MNVVAVIIINIVKPVNVCVSLIATALPGAI